MTPPPDTSFEPPQRLSPSHLTESFESGSPQLDDWLKRRAHRNEAEGASRTYVVCQDNRVVAFYCLANGAILQHAAPGRVRRNMPDSIPVMVLGRMAVGRRFQGRGFGRALVRDAILRTPRPPTSPASARSSSMPRMSAPARSMSVVAFCPRRSTR